MLKLDNRLKKKANFNLLLKNGKNIGGNFVVLKYLKLSNVLDKKPKTIKESDFIESLRIAVTVGLKICKSAVKRNILKRKIREVIRLLIKNEKIKKGYYGLIVAKKEGLEKDYQELEKDILYVLKKSKILND